MPTLKELSNDTTFMRSTITCNSGKITIAKISPFLNSHDTETSVPNEQKTLPPSTFYEEGSKNHTYRRREITSKEMEF